MLGSDGWIDERCSLRISTKFRSVLIRELGIAVGLNKGHIVHRRELAPRPSRRKGVLSNKAKAVRSLIKEVCGYGP